MGNEIDIKISSKPKTIGVEFIVNEDIIIPEGTPRDKYAKYGMFVPLFSDHHYHVIREGRNHHIKPAMIEQEGFFVHPGDIILDVTAGTATAFLIRGKP